jgi:SAM-dependent methyltransferase
MKIVSRIRRELDRIRGQAIKAGLKRRLGKKWQEDEQGRVRRDYPDYETYLKHQRNKLDALRAEFMERHDPQFFKALTGRLEASSLQLKRARVLCLAARQGTEVRAFTDLGAFAVGIDLNPGKDNRHVLVGDFHDLQFATGAVDLVFTNSLDHVYDLDRVLSEVSRILVDGGMFMTEVGVGTLRGTKPGFYESLSWQTADELVAEIERFGFRLRSRSEFQIPWAGEHLQFVKV